MKCQWTPIKRESEMEEYTFEYMHQTDNAILVTDGNKEIWLPKSQISYDESIKYTRHDVILIEVPEWLAEKCEII